MWFAELMKALSRHNSNKSHTLTISKVMTGSRPGTVIFMISKWLAAKDIGRALDDMDIPK
jgi:hypothetical protein